VPMGFFCVKKYSNVKNGRVTPNVKIPGPPLTLKSAPRKLTLKMAGVTDLSVKRHARDFNVKKLLTLNT